MRGFEAGRKGLQSEEVYLDSAHDYFLSRRGVGEFGIVLQPGGFDGVAGHTTYSDPLPRALRQHFLYFFPEPHGHGSLRPVFLWAGGTAFPLAAFSPVVFSMV